ncbi:hypothetical protein ANCCEY_15614 [Ancylostoma ceylanicum]|uniref:Tc1-like transposase DDE domain-containing protein n=1 Tax=Ancylostoma ceylanicum TaxID=53326 RepID=A0A0D6L4I6_9BILA|nr:hypothetical protein ANCCEY_15614 [Ancylostoma ceylanicum]
MLMRPEELFREARLRHGLEQRARYRPNFSHIRGEESKDQHRSLRPAHNSKKVQRWCRENLPDFIHANEWPANSPDVNIVDYPVWAILEEKACAKRHSSVDALRSSLKKAWEEILQETVRAAVESYPKRLKAVIEAKGGHID